MAEGENIQQQQNGRSNRDLFISYTELKLKGKDKTKLLGLLNKEQHRELTEYHRFEYQLLKGDYNGLLSDLWESLKTKLEQEAHDVDLSTLVNITRNTREDFKAKLKEFKAKLKEYKLKLIEKKSAEELVKDIEKVIQNRKLTTRAWNTLSYPFRKAAIRAKKEKIQILREGIVRAGEKNCGNTSAERQYRADLKRLLEKGCRKEQYKFNRNVVGTSAVIFIIGLILFPPLAIATAVVGMLCFFSDLPNRMVQHTRDNVTGSLWEETKQARNKTDAKKVVEVEQQVSDKASIVANPSEGQLSVLAQLNTDGSQTSDYTQSSKYSSLSKAFKRFARMNKSGIGK